MSSFTSLPWKSYYTQSGHSLVDASSEPSITSTYALALTALFTIFVFALEHMLDERQAKQYKVTEFPKQLETTVSKIDSEKETLKKGATKKEEKGDGGSSDLDKDAPMLPQLKEKFTKAQSYGSDKMQFGMISSIYGVVEGTAFLLLGFLPYIWDFSTRLGQAYIFGMEESVADREITITLIFLGVTTIIGTITSLPFEIYSTFYIEKKHGFNKQTPSLFVTDKIKSLLLTMIIGGPFVVALLKIIKWGGEHFYLYVWGFMFLFSVVMMTLVPLVIMPMFNKYEPLKDSELKNQIYQLADRISYPLNKLFVMDGSKRSSHSNAFMFGFGKNKRIVLYDTLMEQVSDGEILAILGHELGHWKLGHTMQNFIITQMYTGLAFWGFSQCYTNVDLYRAFGFACTDDNPVPTMIALLLFFQTIFAPIDKVLTFITTLLTRMNEFAADRFSAELGYSKLLRTGLCKISLENLGAMCVDPWYAMYHYSHPPLVERLEAMMAFDIWMEKEKEA